MYRALRPINENRLAIGDMLGRLWHVKHRWDAILPRYNSPMREIAARLHHQTSSQEKKGGPARIGRGHHQNIPRSHTRSLVRRVEHARQALHAPWTRRQTGKYCLRGCRGGSVHRTVADKEVWHVPGGVALSFEASLGQ